MTRRCLCCYQPLREGEVDYHPQCAKRFFGCYPAPQLPYTRKDINKLAQVVVQSRTTVTGVQAKLSMDMEHDTAGNPQRLTIMGVMGRYILKPQTEQFELLPEMGKDIQRLQRIAERFSKIGSQPEPKPESLNEVLTNVVQYISRRKPVQECHRRYGGQGQYHPDSPGRA